METRKNCEIHICSSYYVNKWTQKQQRIKIPRVFNQTSVSALAQQGWDVCWPSHSLCCPLVSQGQTRQMGSWHQTNALCLLVPLDADNIIKETILKWPFIQLHTYCQFTETKPIIINFKNGKLHTALMSHIYICYIHLLHGIHIPTTISTTTTPV